ncbi:MAG: sister chromatid cohesion protein PDS5 [Anaerolineae bacterium]|jgi:HEAT repeat protein|nr:sister chromatid cohesion protein PDS5 [Anaerolineae bacterium]
MEEFTRAVSKMLSSTDPEEVSVGLDKVRARMPRASDEEKRRYVEMISVLFYIDTLDHPEYVAVVEDAINLVSNVGAAAIPVLMQELEAGDVKAQMAIGQALGRMGAEAIEPLMQEYRESCPAPGCRAFVLYALGKIKSPRIGEALSTAIEAAGADDQELRDSATRALGKFAESIPTGKIAPDMLLALIERLRLNLADGSPAIRAKAVRSLGKLAKHRHLSAEQCDQLAVTLKRLLGEDEHYEWDRAYIVRKEAREALQYV